MRKRKVLRTLGAVSVLALAFSFTTLADDASQFVTGTDVNGIVIGGLTEAEAKAKIEQSYASSYNLTIIEKDGKKENINGTEIGYRVTVPDNLKEILSQQNNTGRQSGPSSDNSHTLELQASYDEALLTARIRGLECINGGSIITTADARISPYQEGQPFTIIPEVQGNNVDAAKTEAVIKAAAASGQSQVNLVENGCYYTVQVTKDNEQLKALCDKMNQSKDMVITYNFGENKEELTGAVFTSWFTGSEDGQIQVDRNAAAAYIAALAAKYDTAGTARVFHTATGKDVTLTGPYGWKLNQATEVEALIAMIRMGQSQTWEPQYTASAASRTAPDWGNTYVEIDLGGLFQELPVHEPSFGIGFIFDFDSVFPVIRPWRRKQHNLLHLFDNHNRSSTVPALPGKELPILYRAECFNFTMDFVPLYRRMVPRQSLAVRGHANGLKQ